MAIASLSPNDRMVVEDYELMIALKSCDMSSILFFRLCQIRKLKQQSSATSTEMRDKPVHISTVFSALARMVMVKI